MMTGPTPAVSVHLVSLGCARNDVDSEELAARLDDDGFRLVDDPAAAQVIMVNTCGFIEQAKKDSIDTLLAAADHKQSGRARAVVAVGCMAERYGRELAEALPEADAVLGFDDYPDIGQRLRRILAGESVAAHLPGDRRRLLPLSPVARGQVSAALPGHGTVITDLPAGLAPASGPRVLRRRLGQGPCAPLKIASGCDRRCAFCAIPAFRGAYLSRPIGQVLAEAAWLADQGVREVLLVSENTSSYGKDFPDRDALAKLLAGLSQIDGLEWIRVSYLQPAEITPGMLAAIAGTPKVVPYFDLSFQHAAPGVLRRMRRFGDPDAFLGLVDQIRALAPTAGIRSNVIVGFPGETEQDVELLSDFLTAARLDVVGVFGYSDEEGTEGAGLPGKLADEQIEQRRQEIFDLVEELCNQRAAERIGEPVQVLVERIEDGEVLGRAAHQGPEVDGATVLVQPAAARVGELVAAVVIDSAGVDLMAQPVS